jgi:hypothetical protein
MAPTCRDPELGCLTGFLKSRVYARLLKRLISECYQTFNPQKKRSIGALYDIEACQIGK